MKKFLISAAAAFSLDQAVKLLIRSNLPLDGVCNLPGGFMDIRHIGNRGAAFGIASGSAKILLLAAAVAAVLMFVWVARRGCQGIPLGLMLGGAAGNSLDRIILGHVTDYLDLRFWPVFNLADIFIAVGVAAFVISTWKAGTTGRVSGDATGNT